MIWIVLGGLLIGLSLGLMGSGGSILTVPILTYLVGQEEKVAIAGSLAIVGGISLLGGLPYARQGLVDGRCLLLFGLPGMAGSVAGVQLSRDVDGSVQLGVFAILMLVAAVLMVRPRATPPPEDSPPRGVLKIVLDGLVVGVITGFVGVGGGFLIVPALVLLGGLPMHRAIGTSLFIIAMKSWAGFGRSIGVLDELGFSLDWKVLGAFIALGVAGSLAGKAVGRRLPQQQLQRAFAAFLVVVGVFVVIRTAPDLLHS